MARKKTPSPYRLKFGGTRKTLPASSLKVAVIFAKYWTNWGQKRVCIEKRLPSGRYELSRCVTRKR
jgi:hypothetical protein